MDERNKKLDAETQDIINRIDELKGKIDQLDLEEAKIRAEIEKMGKNHEK